MPPLFETVTDLAAGAETLKRRRYGVVEMVGGQFNAVRLRPFPKIVSAPGIMFIGNAFHRHSNEDRLWLYYNQPLRFPNYLVLKYAVSGKKSSIASVIRALDVLDEIARLKGSDALLCDVANWRIGAKMLARFGWMQHCPSRWHRHYIKRFYGEYPARAKWIENC
jgi:hypothetical protein